MHLLLGEAEAVGKGVVEDGIDLQVVEAGEDALLRDAQDAREHAEAAVLAVLHRAGEEIAEELERLLAETMGRRVVDRRVVFVDQDDGARSIVRMERRGEHT